MKKIKVEELGCFKKVEAVLGKSRAKCELFKAINYKEIDWVNKRSKDIAGCFPWVFSPQGYEFWRDVYMDTPLGRI